jgi:serine/threonine-protein phosphatase 2A activator
MNVNRGVRSKMSRGSGAVCRSLKFRAEPGIMTTDFASFPRVAKDSSFAAPGKQINSDADVVKFQRSVAFDRIVGFLLLLNESVKGKNRDDNIQSSANITAIGKVLDTLDVFVDEVLPSTGPRRFGNVAFRQWMQKLEEVHTV